MTDFLRNIFKTKDMNNNEEDLTTGTEMSRSGEAPPMMGWNNQDPSMIMISKSDLVYYIIIAVLSVGMIIMFIEYRR